MKSLIVLASFVAFSSRASTYSFSNYEQVLAGITLNNACLTNDEVRTINPVKVCTKYETRTIGGGDNAQTLDFCVASAMKNLVLSRAFTRTICAQYDSSNRTSGCLSYENVADFLPDSIQIKTFNLNDSGDHGSDPRVIVSTFTFPVCN